MRSQSSRLRRGVIAVASVATLSLIMSACGSDGNKAATPNANEKITLKVQDFGLFGYQALYKQYEAAHPNITIVESAEGDLGKYTTALTQHIAASSVESIAGLHVEAAEQIIKLLREAGRLPAA